MVNNDKKRNNKNTTNDSSNRNKYVILLIFLLIMTVIVIIKEIYNFHTYDYIIDFILIVIVLYALYDQFSLKFKN